MEITEMIGALNMAGDVLGQIARDLKDEAKLSSGDRATWNRARNGMTAVTELELSVRNLAAVIELKGEKTWTETL